MTVDLAHLRALLAKASPAPWIYSERDKALSTGQLGADGHVYDGTDWRPVVDTVSESIKADDDGFLITALRNAAPALLDEVEALRARVALLERVAEAARKSQLVCSELHLRCGNDREAAAWRAVADALAALDKVTP